MWMGKCNLCGYEGRLDRWFMADGKIVSCPGCNKFIVRQECEKATMHRKYSARPGAEIIVPYWPPVNTLLELNYGRNVSEGSEDPSSDQGALDGVQDVLLPQGDDLEVPRT
jgi:hypothetical protein